MGFTPGVKAIPHAERQTSERRVRERHTSEKVQVKGRSPVSPTRDGSRTAVEAVLRGGATLPGLVGGGPHFRSDPSQVGLTGPNLHPRSS